MEKYELDIKICFVCEKAINIKDEVSLNKKLLGRKTKRLYCIDCLAEYFELTTDDLLAMIDEFRKQGCDLF